MDTSLESKRRKQNEESEEAMTVPSVDGDCGKRNVESYQVSSSSRSLTSAETVGKDSARRKA